MWNDFGVMRPLWLRKKMTQVEFWGYKAMERSGLMNLRILRALASMERNEPRRAFRGRIKSCKSGYYWKSSVFHVHTVVEYNKLWRNPLIAWRKKRHLKVYEYYEAKNGGVQALRTRLFGSMRPRNTG